MSSNKARFKVGDKVVLKDYETLVQLRNVSPANEKFQRHYNYIKGKEPLTISQVWEPKTLSYSEDCDNLGIRGKVVDKYQYNIQTPLSKLYLFSDDELDPYEDTDSE